MSATSDRLDALDPVEPTLCTMSWISWRSIFAGVFTSVAFGIVLTLIGSALGFTVLNPLSSDPLEGVGMAVGIWWLVAGIVSLAAGGFVGGFFAGNRGMLHGFLVWTVVLVVGVVFTSLTATTALRALGAVGSGAASMAAGITEQATELANQRVDQLRRSFRTPSQNDDPAVTSILRDTGVEELQPLFWMRQMREARREMQGAVNRLMLDSSNSEAVLSEFLNRQQERLQAMQNRDFDREQAVQNLMQRRYIPREEAERQLDAALRVYNDRLDTLEVMLEEGREELQDARQYLQDVSERARLRADELASAAAKSAMMAAIALVLGALAAAVAGRFGVRSGIRCESMMPVLERGRP